MTLSFKSGYAAAAPHDTVAPSAGASQHSRVGIVTVTHDSDRFFDEYMAALQAQTRQPDLVVLVDAGSSQPAFLERAGAYSVPVEVLLEANVGFCVGTNIGWRRVRDFEYVVFLNPDAFLAPDFLEHAVAYMDAHANVGMVTPSLIRYDIDTHQPLDAIDTTGVIRGWTGTAERDDGQPVAALQKYTQPNEIKWLCAAVAMGRREAMNAVLEHGDQLFDESFFMYKDDADLSWRVRRAGWLIMHHPALRGFHCRGWQSRSQMSRRARLLTARNEIKMCLKNRSPFVITGLVKYALVRFFDL